MSRQYRRLQGGHHITLAAHQATWPALLVYSSLQGQRPTPRAWLKPRTCLRCVNALQPCFNDCWSCVYELRTIPGWPHPAGTARLYCLSKRLCSLEALSSIACFSSWLRVISKAVVSWQWQACLIRSACCDLDQLWPCSSSQQLTYSVQACNFLTGSTLLAVASGCRYHLHAHAARHATSGPAAAALEPAPQRINSGCSPG